MRIFAKFRGSQPGFPGPLGIRNKTFGFRDSIFEGESLYVLDCTFFHNNQDLGNLASAVTQKSIV